MTGEIDRNMHAQDCWATKASKSPGATKDQSKDPPRADGPSSSRSEWIAKIGTAVSAIMASSCCWLPPLLILMGVSGAGMAKTLETYRPLFMVVTFGFLGMAFYLTYRPRRAAVAGQAGSSGPEPVQDLPQDLVVEDCCAPSTKRRFNMMALNKAMLWAVTAMAIVFLFFPHFVTGLFGSAGGELTADMHHTVLTVEGMTCKGWQLKAETAIQTAPGVLAVEVDYRTGQATIGTEPGQPIPRADILSAIKSIGYRGKFVDQ